jgi:hypothetical protein
MLARATTPSSEPITAPATVPPLVLLLLLPSPVPLLPPVAAAAASPLADALWLSSVTWLPSGEGASPIDPSPANSEVVLLR